MAETIRYAWQALHRHFDADGLTTLSSSRRRFAPHLLPDLQTVIGEELKFYAPQLHGVHQPHEFIALKLSDLVIREGQAVIALTPLQYQDIDIGKDEPYASLHNGLWLCHIGREPVAILLSQFFEPRGDRTVQVEIAYIPGQGAANFAGVLLKRIQEDGERSRYYRGKILSFEPSVGYTGMQGTMRIHALPKISRGDVVLAEETMAQLDRDVFEFDRHKEGLTQLGQSTRKGILLFGPPGTGKTHVIRYISANLVGRVTILVTAEQMMAIGSYIALARTLQPSIVDRSRAEMQGQKAESLLNRLLNEMDGLGPDADIPFMLTTNRPEDIEDALSSCPGRVDEGIEIPVPDKTCRERLIGLYGKVLKFDDGAVTDAVTQSENGSAAFVKEMVRRLAQRNLSADAMDRVSHADVTGVFSDRGILSNQINRRIVGLGDEPRRPQSGEPGGCDGSRFLMQAQPD